MYPLYQRGYNVKNIIAGKISITILKKSSDITRQYRGGPIYEI
jgi:hypothetical protein